MRLLHVVAFSKKLSWLAQTKVITLKTRLHAVNARWKRLSQLSFKLQKLSRLIIFFISQRIMDLIIKGTFTNAVSTFLRMHFHFLAGKFLIKMQCIALSFYLGLKNEPWFGPAGSENACVFRNSKVELRLSFSTCVYCMLLHFQRKYAGLSQPR